MPSYAAFLGHQPHISTAELAAVVPGFSLTEKVNKKLIIFESDSELDDDIIEDLGGTIVIARQLDKEVESLEDIPKLMAQQLSNVKRKVTFAMRTIGIKPQEVQGIFRKCKKLMKDRGLSARYVGSARKPALPLVLHNEGLISGKRGCELTIVADDEEDLLWVGRTICAQNVEAYTKRDMGKPARDTTIGLLPPKLAQVLLNFGAWAFAEMEEEDDPLDVEVTVFDPFCGTGVIPMECLLRNYPVLASDISQKAINACTKNLEWLRKEEDIQKKDTESTVWKQDALKPFDLEEPPDVIVTETTLGPPLKKSPTATEANKHRRENEKLQAGFLQNAASTLPGVPIVCTWPVWYTGKKQIWLEKVWDAVEKAGYEPVLPHGIEPSVAGRVSLLYRRPDQFVGREIVLLKPKG